MFDLNELKLLRTSLDVISIKGSDAKYLAALQVKLEEEININSKPPKEGKK